MSASALTFALVLSLANDPRCGAGPDVEPERIVAIAKQESGYDPFVIGVNADRARKLTALSVRSSSAQEASAKAAALLAQGRSIDLGLTGINAQNLEADGLTVASAFDACASIAASYRHLRRDFKAAAWELAHRRYNCGRFTCGEAYAASVRATMNRVKQAQSDPLEVAAAPVSTPRPPPSMDDALRATPPVPNDGTEFVDALHPGKETP